MAQATITTLVHNLTPGAYVVRVDVEKASAVGPQPVANSSVNFDVPGDPNPPVISADQPTVVVA